MMYLALTIMASLLLCNFDSAAAHKHHHHYRDGSKFSARLVEKFAGWKPMRLRSGLAAARMASGSGSAASDSWSSSGWTPTTTAANMTGLNDTNATTTTAAGSSSGSGSGSWSDSWSASGSDSSEETTTTVAATTTTAAATTTTTAATTTSSTSTTPNGMVAPLIDSSLSCPCFWYSFLFSGCSSTCSYSATSKQASFSCEWGNNYEATASLTWSGSSGSCRSQSPIGTGSASLTTNAQYLACSLALGARAEAMNWCV